MTTYSHINMLSTACMSPVYGKVTCRNVITRYTGIGPSYLLQEYNYIKYAHTGARTHTHFVVCVYIGLLM